jgi:hypothetical protein
MGDRFRHGFLRLMFSDAGVDVDIRPPPASLVMARWIAQCGSPRGISVSEVERLATCRERRLRRLLLFPPEGDIPPHL